MSQPLRQTFEDFRQFPTASGNSVRHDCDTRSSVSGQGGMLPAIRSMSQIVQHDAEAVS